MKKKITILIPCYNEQDSLPSLYESLIEMADSQGNYVWEFLFINDGSTDNTLQVIKHYREKDSLISYLDVSRNFGKECAMLAGFDYAKGDIIFYKNLHVMMYYLMLAILGFLIKNV